MAEGEGFWGHVIEHLFVYLAGIVLCVLGAFGWAYFPRQAAFVANHIDPSSAAAKEDINREERAKKNLKKCILYHWHELLAQPVQHLVRGKAVLWFQAEDILSGKTCRSELDELAPDSTWVPPKFKAVNLEKIQTNRQFWNKEEWSQIAAAGPILGTPAPRDSQGGSSTSVPYGPLTATPLSLAELRSWLKIQAIRDAVAAWANAFRSMNAAAIAECYAQVVERYFERNDVTRDQIRHDQQSVFARTLYIRKFEVNDIKIDVDTIQPSTDSVTNPRTTATFRKEWDTAELGDRNFSSEAMEKLTFTSSPQGWKIIREEVVSWRTR
jgi:hypothetical protein